MSSLRRSKVAAPSTPAAGKVEEFYDLNDLGRYKVIDGDSGLTRILTAIEWPKNHFINPSFAFAQRQVAATLTSRTPGTTGRAYGPDQWFVANEANDTQFQQVDTIASPEASFQDRYFGRWKKITANGKILVGQVLAAENMSQLRGRRIRLQLKMKRTVAAGMTVRLGLAQLTAAGTHDTVPGYVNGAPSGTFVSAWNGNGTDPTLGTNVTRINPVANSQDGGTIVGGGLNCVLTGAKARYSACFDVPSDAKNLIPMVWSDNQLTVNDELNMGECGLYDGVEVIDWISPIPVHDLMRCYRFYAKSFPLAVLPAQNAGLTGAWRGHAANAGAVAIVHGFLPFPVPMRAAPGLVTLFNPAAANAFLRYIITPSDATATTATQITERGFEVTATGLAAWIAGGGVAIHYIADSSL